MSLAHDTQLIDSILSRLGKPLVMVGMMGSGKTRLGRLLAESLDIPFYDSDEEIEKAAGCTIPEIFERYGESFFRDRESRVIQRLLEQGRSVIATGGGAVMNPDTMAGIHRKSVSIWVRAELSILVERTGRNSNRPLLKGRNSEDVLARLAEIRNPVYETADIVVDSHSGPVAGILNTTLERLEYYLRRNSIHE